MIQTRTSWNSSSEELGLSVHGATVPPTFPEALTWGNKSPTASGPSSLSAASTHAQRTYTKESRVGVGTPTDLSWL